MSFGTAARDTKEDVSEKRSRSTDSPASLPKEKRGVPHGDVEVNAVDVITDQKTLQSPSWFARNRGLVRCVKLCALAALILGWWISATILPATRHRWIVQTFWAWSFIAIIAFRFIPNSVVTRPVEAVWIPLVQGPFFLLPKYVRYSLGWLAFIGIVIGCAFGFKLESVSLSFSFDNIYYMSIYFVIQSLIRVFSHQGTNYGDRAISVLGLFVIQFGFWATSKHRSHIQWQTVIVGLFTQQAVAVFVLKTGAGYHAFRWFANLASDFSNEGLAGATFFFDQDTVENKRWFFVNIVRYMRW